VKHFNRAKNLMRFVKLNIAKAFDSVRWKYLLEVMERVGFGQRWRDIMALLWSTTTSRILLNGALGRPIKHGRGLRQGGLLSPMLFIRAIDPLQKLLDKATQMGLLHLIGAYPVKLRTSLYADNAALFVRPYGSDIRHMQQLLHSFSSTTGLCTNIRKSEVFSICCDSIDVQYVLGEFQANLGNLPCKYLRLPLRMGHITRDDE
jgi:hypothetical protein